MMVKIKKRTMLKTQAKSQMDPRRRRMRAPESKSEDDTGDSVQGDNVPTGDEEDNDGGPPDVPHLPMHVTGPENEPDRLRPRVDVSGEFKSKIALNYFRYRYGRPERGHGFDVFVDSDGILGFDIRSDPELAATHGSGRDVFNSLMK